jgi:hypothetical protein
VVLSALVAVSGPSEVKSVPEPAGKQLELPDPPLELPPLDGLASSAPDPELDIPLDAPFASSLPGFVEPEDDWEPELLPLPPDDPDPPPPLEPPEPLDPISPPELGPSSSPGSG